MPPRPPEWTLLSRARSRHGDVLRVQGARRPIGSLLCGPAELMPRGAAALDPVRRRVAPGRHHRGCRHRRLERGRRASPRGPRASPPPRRGGRSAPPARSISDRLKRTWSSSTRKRWGWACSRRSGGSRPSAWGRRTPGVTCMVTHVDASDRRASTSRSMPGHPSRRAAPAGRRERRAKEESMGLFTKNYPPEIAAHPAGSASS